MKISKKHRILSLVLSFLMVLSAVPVTAFAADDDSKIAAAEESTQAESQGVSEDGESAVSGEDAETTEAQSGENETKDAANGTVVANSEELAAAIAAAKDGDTITLGEGEFTTYGNTSPKKSLTFQGVGDKTVWTIGDLSKNVGGEGNGDYSFDGCETITFKNMTLKSDSVDYRGFIRINNTVVEDCTLMGKTAYWGYETAAFVGSTFNAPEGDYALWDYSTKAMSFDGCRFNISGKGVNVYVEAGNAGEATRTVEVKDCTVKSTEANKAFLNIKNKTQAYEVTLSGTNIVEGLIADSITGNNLYQVETTEVTATSGKTVKVQEKATDGTVKTVYEVKAPSAAAAKVGDTEYATLAEAVAAAQDGQTVTLLNDVTLENEFINITKSMVIPGPIPEAMSTAQRLRSIILVQR